MIQNTPWNAILDIEQTGANIQDVHLLCYYLFKLFGIANTNSLRELDRCETASAKDKCMELAAQHFVLPDRDDDMLDMFIALHRKLIKMYVLKTNMLDSKLINKVLDDDKLKYVRNYVSAHAPGVTAHKCKCCGQLFVVKDTQVGTTHVDGDTYMNVVPTLNTDVVCHICYENIEDVTNQEVPVIISDMLNSCVKLKLIAMTLHHVSIAPPSDYDYPPPPIHDTDNNKVNGKKLIHKGRV